MLDLSFHNIIHSNFINFMIMTVIIIWLCLKINITEKLEKFRLNIEDKVRKSDNEKENARIFLKDTQKSVENLGSELEKIEQNAEQSAKNLADKIMQETQIQIEKLEQSTNKNIEAQASKIREELKQEISEITLKKAKERIEQKLNADKVLHRKHIDESIDRLDKAEI